MSNLYTFSSSIAIKAMPDSSGVALYNDFSGLSAFLKANPDSFFQLVNMKSPFDVDELINWLDIKKGEAKKLLSWLEDSQFVQQLD